MPDKPPARPKVVLVPTHGIQKLYEEGRAFGRSATPPPTPIDWDRTETPEEAEAAFWLGIRSIFRGTGRRRG